MNLFQFLRTEISFRQHLTGLLVSLTAGVLQMLAAGSIIPVVDESSRREMLNYLNIDLSLNDTLLIFIVLLISSLFVRLYLQYFLLSLSHHIGHQLVHAKFNAWIENVKINRDERITKLQNDFSILNRKIVNSIIFPYFILISSVVQFIFLLSILIIISIKVVLFIGGIYAIIYGLSFLAIKKQLYIEGQNFILKNKNVISNIREIFSLQTILKAHRSLDNSLRRYLGYDIEVRKTIIMINILSTVPKYILEATIGIIIGIIIFLEQNNFMTLEFSSAMSFAFVLLRMLPSAQSAVGAISNLLSAQPVLEEFDDTSVFNSIVPPNLKILSEEKEFSHLKMLLNNEVTGHICILSGPSGCGKSRFLQALEANNSGTEIEFRKDSKCYTLNLGNNAQNTVYLPNKFIDSELLVKDYLVFELPNIPVEVRNTFGVVELYESSVKCTNLSDGEKQRLLLLHFFELQNSLLFFDETLSGINLELKNSIIGNFIERGNNLVIVNHGLKPEDILGNVFELKVMHYDSVSL